MLLVATVHNKKLYLTLMIADSLAVLLSFLVAYGLRFNIVNSELLLPILLNGKVFSVLGLVVLFNFVFDLYEVRYWVNSMFSPFRIILASLSVATTMSFVIYLFAAESSDFIGRGVFLGALGGYLIFSLLFRWQVQKQNQKRILGSLWLIVGGGENRKEFEKECQLSGNFLSFKWLDSADENLPEKFETILASNSIHGIVICDSMSDPLVKSLMDAKSMGSKIYDFQFFFERVWGKVLVRFLRPDWFIFSTGFTLLNARLMSKLKMIIDFIIALFLLILTLPILILASLAIKIDSRGGIIYKQKRVGLNGRLFTIYKLRSMCTDAEVAGARWTEESDDRVTRVGQLIRLTRIDELPQLINILKGDMSFVGPRPERPEFTAILEKEIPYYRLRHLVKPGLTGWAQVSYSYAASMEDSLQKLQYELFYIKNHSVWLDFIIIFKTFVVVLFGKGR